MTISALCLVMLVGAQPTGTPAQKLPAATASVRGRVIARDTGLPLRRAEVMLNQLDEPGTGATSAGQGRESRTTMTDADGRYEFTNLPAGI